MDYDPREAKLPKWAIEALADARRRGDLAWPTTECPEPDIWINGFGAWIKGESFLVNGMKAYAICSGYRVTAVQPVWFNYHGAIYHSPDMKGLGSRPNGKYWLSERDAWIAAWWQGAREAAEKLHRIAQKVREAE